MQKAFEKISYRIILTVGCQFERRKFQIRAKPSKSVVLSFFNEVAKIWRLNGYSYAPDFMAAQAKMSSIFVQQFLIARPSLSSCLFLLGV